MLITKFLIHGTLGAVEEIPIVGPLVAVPTKFTVNAITSIALLSIALLTAAASLVTLSCTLLTGSIRILSSASSGIYHLFIATKKDPQKDIAKNL